MEDAGLASRPSMTKPKPKAQLPLLQGSGSPVDAVAPEGTPAGPAVSVSGMKTILRDVVDSFQQKVDSRMDKIEGMVNAMQNEACYDYAFDGADQAYYNDGWVYGDGTHHTHDMSEDEAENTEDENDCNLCSRRGTFIPPLVISLHLL